MTVTVSRPRVQDLPSRSETLQSLAVFDGRAILKHPVVLVGALGSLAWAFWGLTDEAPVLNRISVNVVWSMLPLALSVALVVGWATLRRCRRG